MRIRILAGTEVATTTLGFGCAGLFRLPWKADRRAILEAAYELGIRHFDVAPMYGLGRAEAELAPVLKHRRGDMTITTKFGIDPTAMACVYRGCKGLCEWSREPCRDSERNLGLSERAHPRVGLVASSTLQPVTAPRLRD